MNQCDGCGNQLNENMIAVSEILSWGGKNVNALQKHISKHMYTIYHKELYQVEKK